MCGRYSFFDTERLYERFDVPRDPGVELTARYNVAPETVMPVIVARGRRRVALRRWGITPRWAKETPSRSLINARAETLGQKPTFQHLLAHGRCLVPARGWFEWQKIGGRKIPYFFRHKGGELLAFAGLCDEDEYAIVTTRALTALQRVHDRMPLVLRVEDESAWLDTAGVRKDVLLPALPPLEQEKLTGYAVSAAVNRPANDSPDIVRPWRPR